jgi:hypothetical protein
LLKFPVRLIAVFLMIACADTRVSRSSDAKQQGESLSTQAAGRGNGSESADAHFTLVSIDSFPLPVHYPEGEETCEKTFYAGSYDIGPATWASWDSVAVRCPSRLARMQGAPSRYSGTIERKGDTLYLSRRRDTDGVMLEIDRAFIRGDSLVTGGEQWGLPRVYIRTRQK